MLNNNFSSIYSIAKYNFKKLFSNPRTYILICLQFIYLWYLIDPIIKLSTSIGVRVTPWIFPHITSHMISQMILMLGIIVLFADSPFMDEDYNYIVIRSGKEKWVLGQLLYMVLATIGYFLVLFLITVLLTLPNIFLSFEWGKLMNTLANTNAGEGFDLVINLRILLLHSPVKATLISFLLCCGSGIIIAVTIFIINLKNTKSMGVVVGTFIVLLDRAIFYNFPNFRFAFLSPVSLSRISDLTISKEGISPTITYAFIFEAMAILLVSIIAILMVRKKYEVRN
ncbi:MAG: hypothetical protein ACRCXA_08915 [Peptostreptococcaceae bacterium]